MRDVVIVAGARTPVGNFGGVFKSMTAVQLGALVLKETLKKAGLRPLATDDLIRFEPDALKGIGIIELEKEGYDYDEALQPIQVDEVIMGNVVSAGQGQNVARQALMAVGALIGAMSGRHAVWGGLRMLLAGGSAAAVTFGVGHLVGISVLG